ncbi:hypothetical protein G6F65_006882 [Rhizopus arrhizus]|nr:hypothetical protein G6F65_006882 [Rhizopus arrhizus]
MTRDTLRHVRLRRLRNKRKASSSGHHSASPGTQLRRCLALVVTLIRALQIDLSARAAVWAPAEMHSGSVVRYGQHESESLSRAASGNVADRLWTLLPNGWGRNRSSSPVRLRAELVTEIPVASGETVELQRLRGTRNTCSIIWEHSRAPTRGTPRVAWASGTETKKI